MAFAGHTGVDGEGAFRLIGSSIVEGFRRQGYLTLGSGSVNWFDTATETGSVLAKPFEHFHFAGNTWSLQNQLDWLEQRMAEVPNDRPRFVFLNVGETHVPYWHEGASWSRWPSPCVPFGGENCSALESARRQKSCLEWVDHRLANLLSQFCDGTVLICADHGDCWGENGLWEHGFSHRTTLTVPLLLRVRGKLAQLIGKELYLVGGFVSFLLEEPYLEGVPIVLDLLRAQILAGFCCAEFQGH